MCAGTPLWVGKFIFTGKWALCWFLFLFSSFFSFFSFSREWERGLLGDMLLLMAPSVATLPLHNRRQGGLTATALWASGGLCEPRVGA